MTDRVSGIVALLFYITRRNGMATQLVFSRGTQLHELGLPHRSACSLEVRMSPGHQRTPKLRHGGISP